MNKYLTLLLERFVNRPDLYYEQWASARNRHGYNRVDAQVTNLIMLKHLENEITVSLPPFDSQALCKWCCWDNDHENGNLPRIEKVLRELGLNPLRESVRPGREGHTWLFFDQKLPASFLMRFDRFIRDSIADLVIEDELEFFPKQSRPCNVNGVRMPFGVNLKWEAEWSEGWFEGPPKSLEEQLKWFSEQQPDSALKVARLASALINTDPVLPKVRKRKSANSQVAAGDLNAVEHDEYFSCACPSCGHLSAYFYKDGRTLFCNRKNNCGLTRQLRP